MNATDHSRAPERATLIRLVVSEAPHFPAILDLWHNRGIVPIIAEPLAKLAVSGLLDADDPALAAEHLSAPAASAGRAAVSASVISNMR